MGVACNSGNVGSHRSELQVGHQCEAGPGSLPRLWGKPSCLSRLLVVAAVCGVPCVMNSTAGSSSVLSWPSAHLHFLSVPKSLSLLL